MKMSKIKMPYSVAKEIIKQTNVLPKDHSHDDLKAIYNKFDWNLYEWKNDFSPLYNQFTGHLHKKQIKEMVIGEKNGLYFDAEKRKVITWTGSKIGEVKSASYYKSGGFAPSKRVSITFKYFGMLFRGICSYESMQCFTFKRIA